MFLKGLEQISKQLETLTGHTEKSAKKMSSGVSMSAMSFLKINAALGMAKMGISKMMANIPELGRTFQIAGDIISRNFLWPLRQQLMPMLQKFLNWVRDHRAMFVRWGGVLQSVFNMVVTGIKAAINILKPFYEAAMKFFKGIFGGTADSIDKIANMILFKISAVMVYLEAVLKPSMQAIANIVFGIAEAIKSFVQGLAEGYAAIGGLGPEITELIKSLGNLADSLFGAGEGWRTFGKIIGVVVFGPLKFMLKTLSGIADMISMIIDLTGNMSDVDFQKKHGTKKESNVTDYQKKQAEKYKAAPVLSQEDLISGKGSSVIKPSTVSNRNVNISNLVINADTAEGGKAAADAFYIQARKHINIKQAAVGGQ
jgi:hypothetical protein